MKNLNSSMTEAVIMRSKSMDRFLYDDGLRHERVNTFYSNNNSHLSIKSRHILLFLNACKQTFHICHVCISQKVEANLM